ncbi:MAG: hypothetical protein ABJC33_10615, partial [Betaproteobacteria bacterium]
MFAPAVHFSLTTITDPTRHHAHNAWRQLDYHPELMLQPGVASGETWVRSPDCAKISAIGTDTLARFHYAELYWLRAPEDRSAQAFKDFGERAFQMGRRPDCAWASEAFSGFFVPLKGYVNSRALVSADALPLRPTTGIHLTVSRFLRHDAAAEAAFRWHDQVRIPQLLECSGVAGAWTFTTRALFKPARDIAAPALRLQIVYLDTDPLLFSEALARRDAQSRTDRQDPDMTGVEERLFAGPLRSIIP